MASVPHLSRVPQPDAGARPRAARRGHGGRRSLCDTARRCGSIPMESPQLSPAGNARALPRDQRARVPTTRRDVAARMACPRCSNPSLSLTQDLQRTTRFRYWRCDRGHGRYSPSLQFLLREEFHPPAVAARVRAPEDAGENDPLLGLRRAGGPRAQPRGLRLLRRAHRRARYRSPLSRTVRQLDAAERARTPPSTSTGWPTLLLHDRAYPGREERSPAIEGGDLVAAGLPAAVGVLRVRHRSNAPASPVLPRRAVAC